MLVIATIVLSSIFLAPHSSAQESIWDRWSTFWWNIQLEALDNATASVEPLGQHDFKFKYWNGGVVDDTRLPLQVYFSITEVNGEGWTAFVDPPWTYMDAAEIKEGVVHVYANERPSSLASFTLQAKMYVYFPRRKRAFSMTLSPLPWRGAQALSLRFFS